MKDCMRQWMSEMDNDASRRTAMVFNNDSFLPGDEEFAYTGSRRKSAKWMGGGVCTVPGLLSVYSYFSELGGVNSTVL